LTGVLAGALGVREPASIEVVEAGPKGRPWKVAEVLGPLSGLGAPGRESLLEPEEEGAGRELKKRAAEGGRWCSPGNDL
jgi:hypothetical protein